MKKFCVYKHLFPNGKIYFGITSKRVNERWQNGTGYDKTHQPVMYNAIQKYGWDNIQHIILYKDLSFKDACDMEKFLIKKYKTNCNRYGNKYGYNMTDGGEGTFGHKLSDEAREKISKGQIGKVGKECPNSKPVVCDGIEYESLTDFKNKNKVKGAVNSWLLGKKGMPKEWYDKKLRYKDQDSSMIYCQKSSWSNKIKYDNRIFNSQRELADYIGVNTATLSNWLNKKANIPKYIKDKGLEYLNKENHILQEQSHPSKTKVQYNSVVYESQIELAKFLNINKGTLWAWLNNKNPMPQEYKDKGLKYIK